MEEKFNPKLINPKWTYTQNKEQIGKLETAEELKVQEERGYFEDKSSYDKKVYLRHTLLTNHADRVHTSLVYGLTFAMSKDINADQMALVVQSDARKCAIRGLKSDLLKISPLATSFTYPRWCLSYRAAILISRMNLDNTNLVRGMLIDQAASILQKLDTVYKVMVYNLRHGTSWVRGKLRTEYIYHPMVHPRVTKIRKEKEKLEKLLKSAQTHKPKFPIDPFSSQKVSTSINDLLKSVNKMNSMDASLLTKEDLPPLKEGSTSPKLIQNPSASSSQNGPKKE